MGRRLDEYETFEGKIEHKAPRSYLVEMTLGGRYFVPFSCIDEMSDPDADGNREFTVTAWWWRKRDEFEVKD